MLTYHPSLLFSPTPTPAFSPGPTPCRHLTNVLWLVDCAWKVQRRGIRVGIAERQSSTWEHLMVCAQDQGAGGMCEGAAHMCGVQPLTVDSEHKRQT